MHHEHAAILQAVAEDLVEHDEGSSDERHRAHAISIILRRLASELLFDADPATAPLRLTRTGNGRAALVAQL